MNKLILSAFLGLIFLGFGSYSAEIENKSTKAEYNSENHIVYIKIAEGYLDLKNYDETVKNYKKALDILRNLIEKDSQMAVDSFGKGKQKKSKEYYQRIIKLNLKAAKVYMKLGSIYSQKQDYGKAIESYQRSYSFNPNENKARQFLKDIYEKIGYKKRVNTFQERIFPESLHYGGMDLHLTKGIKFNPTYLAEVFYKLGNKYLEKNEYNKSIIYFKKAIYYKPNYVKPYIALAKSFKQKGQYNKAIMYLRQALKVNPNNFNIYNLLGEIYEKKGQYNKAIEYFQESLEINPNDYSIYNFLGNIYSRLGKSKKAIRYFRKALEINPNSPETHFNLGYHYLKIGCEGEAFKEIKKLRQLQEDNWANVLITEIIEKKVPKSRGVK